MTSTPDSNRWMVTIYITSHLNPSLLLSLLPAMAGGHVCIQILHSTEGVITGLTPLHPAEEGPLLSRILATGSSMLSHGFLDPVLLCTMWTDENFIWHRLFRTMSDSCVLSQSLFCHVLPATLLTSKLCPLDAAFLVIS